MSEFINFYLKSEEDKLKKKWKLIDYIVNENSSIEENYSKNNLFLNKKTYFSISKLKEILKKNNK